MIVRECVSLFLCNPLVKDCNPILTAASNVRPNGFYVCASVCLRAASAQSVSIISSDD